MTGHPKLAVSACIWQGPCVLLIKRSQSPNKDLWSLPGGHVHFGEKLMDAAHRELHEETGIEAGALTLVDFTEIMPTRDLHYVLAVFTGLWKAGMATASSDAVEVSWLAPEDFTGLHLTDNLETIVEKAARLTAREK